ncbi:MAG: orotate phosphoribosyltransferase [Planctomycetaceae bacterium]|nr:MAG: orotate phosphoribosyltransferase [Planctomycetaceae bacterium]
MVTTYKRERLVELFRERALRFGQFTLASGKSSSYYLDGKQITLHAEGLALVSTGLLALLSDLSFSAVGGLTLGADPIVGGMLAVAALRGQPLQGFLVRKEAKGHGTQRFIEGPLQPHDRVVVVEDVVTTGGSALQAVDRVQEYGASVVAVAGIVDRCEGGAQAIAQRGLPFRCLLSIRDFGIEPIA